MLVFLILSMTEPKAFAQNAKGQCPPQAQEVDIVFKTKDVKPSYEKLTHKWRQVLEIPEDMFLLGFLFKSYFYHIDLKEFSVKAMTKDISCVYITKAEVTFAMEDAVIFIHEALKKGSCSYDRIKSHEDQLLKELGEYLKEEEALVKYGIRKLLKQIPPEQILSNVPMAYERATNLLTSKAKLGTSVLKTILADKVREKQLKIERENPHDKLIRGCADE